MGTDRLFVLVFTCALTSAAAMTIERTFRDLYAGHWRHINALVVNERNGDVILGTENMVYRLNSDLTVIQRLTTGPKFDHYLCPPPDLPCKYNRTKLRNFVKGLAIDYDHNSVIMCLTVPKGGCMIVDMDDITNIKKNVYKSIVSINPATSNLLFIAPGLNSESVLYVGQAYDSLIGGREYLDQVNLISSRNVQDLNFTYLDDNGGTKISAIPGVRMEDQHRVKFLHGFSHGDYVYFVTTRHHRYDTWIIRLCKEDQYFQSYVEFPVICSTAGKNREYREAKSAFYEEKSQNLYIAFKTNSSTSGAVCAFNMRDTETLFFDKAVEYCADGKGYLGPAYIHAVEQCNKSDDGPKFCGDPLRSAIEGQKPIFREPIMEFDGEYPSSVTAVHKTDHQVLFVGTTAGYLKKIVLLGVQQVYVVDTLRIEHVGHGHVIEKDMMLSPDQSAIYLTTSGNKLVKVNVNHCEKQTTCEACTSILDAVCGWCVMDGTCTEKNSCRQSAVSPHWLPSRKRICAKMADMEPSVLSYERIQTSQEKQEIQFRLQQVMLSSSTTPQLHCSFSTQTAKAKTVATVQNELVKCPLPSNHDLDSKPEGKDYRNLEVEFHVSGRPIVKRSISVYDCTMHKNCTSCTKSTFNCTWDYSTHSCQASDSTSAPAGITVTDKCPRVEVSSQNQGDIVVHSGKSKRIAVRLVNMQLGQTDDMQCRFEYIGKVYVVNGTVSSSNLVCDSVKFEFSESQAFVSATFSVLWGKNKYPLDIPSKITVQIYKCASMVESCGRCLTLGQEYECGWCNGTCELQAGCSSNWLEPSATCPNPQIFRVSPNIGPIKGQTNVSVTGINLGKAYTDIKGGVTVAGMNCVVHADHFELSTKFNCLTDPAPAEMNGTITVLVDGLYRAESSAIFYFVDPKVEELHPPHGPKSGGTTITIKGKYMNAGTSIMVDLAGSSCKVIRANESELLCQTSQQVTSDNNVDVEVSFGGYKRLLNQKFKYEEDPVIEHVSNAFSLFSGGTIITIKGERLGLIQNPEIFLERGGQNMTCQHLLIPSSQHFLLCNAPPISFVPYGMNYSETNPMEVHFGLNLDGVVTYRNLSHQSKFEPIKYYPDPDVKFLPEGDKMIKFEQNQKLVIKGRFRSINPMISDVKVLVGKMMCGEITASDTAITCNPPEDPGGLDSEGRAPVTLRIGFFRLDIGYISYFKAQPDDKPITMGIILGVVLPIIFIIVLLALCIIRRQRKTVPPDGGIPDMLKEEEPKDEEEHIGMNHVSVKADMNGQIPDQDSGPYVSELLTRIDNEATRQAVSDLLIPRSKINIGEIIGKGVYGNTYEAQYKTCKDADSQEQDNTVAIKALQGKEQDNTVAIRALQGKEQDNTVAIKALQGKEQDNTVAIRALQGKEQDNTVAIRALQGKEQDNTVAIKALQGKEQDNTVAIRALQGKEQDNTVAIKALQGCNRDSDSIDAFLVQCVTLRDLQHPNVLPILGVSVSSIDEPFIVRPHLQRGDLRNYWLQDDKVVKVSEFSVTQMYPAEYYNMEDGRIKDVKKWWAPEAIDNMAFSHKTDCWSYGIVLWELLTRGVTPYPDVEAKDLKEYLNGGHRLKKPRQCPENVYLLMLQCWTDVPNDRPTFQEIGAEISQFISGDETGNENQPLQTKIEPGGSQEYLEVIG
ncbi:hypothetical protein FSP39_001037 [Pinctada imbricata]|uniref:Hepatocyte growth factor receptor n=1 Tax=Pinctada imbricata TaxID=66713 RepID=A0AA88YAK6_PINIB|nr:hypothetical protein FSP39_001037 [Pinctada imbricata]